MMRLAKAVDADARLEAAHASASLDNPMCGDRVTLDLRTDADGRIVEIGHAVRGCVLCRAATALLREHAPGHGRHDLAAVRAALRAHLRGEGSRPEDEPWHDLAVFDPVAPHKSRHDCVLLPFDALLRALPPKERGSDHIS
jgi:nitrogen fixation NifU-like protein